MIAPMLEIEEYMIFDLLNAYDWQRSVTVIGQDKCEEYFDDLLSFFIEISNLRSKVLMSKSGKFSDA